MSDVIDDDTEQAILALWRQTPALVALCPQPATGRLKSTTPGADVQAAGVTVQVDCQFDSRQLAFADPKGSAPWNDNRKATITIRGVRADVTKAAAAVLDVFGRKLGAPGQPALTYPSGARFIRWWPTNQAAIEEDKDTKAGKDVWKATIEAKVWSVRTT